MLFESNTKTYTDLFRRSLNRATLLLHWEDMVPDTAEYLARIRQYADTRDPLAQQKESPSILAELIANRSEAQLTIRPAKNKWSVGEILAHLAEDEIATAWRYR